MPFGYHGKFLRVNLSNGAITVDEHDEIWYRRYLGATAACIYYLLKETPPCVDPLGPENKLIFAAGVVGGLPVSGCGRNSVGTKSPLGGALAKCEAGGFFGAEMKHAGFDGIVIEGQAEKPVYLWIKDGQAELRDASHLWGMAPLETEEAIKQEVGEKLARFACIGPGGERMVRYAAIVQDLRSLAARSGPGAVMGSKKLKAIAVRGKTRLEYADPEKIKLLAKEMAQGAPTRARRLWEYGTGAMMTEYNLAGNLPTRNFRVGYFEDPERISAQKIKETIQVGKEGCYACAVRCKKNVKLEEPYSLDPRYGGPEYESIAAFGNLLDIGDLNAICWANQLCNQYGIDTISTGSTIAFAIECYENGLLTKDDCDGLELTWGKVDVMLKLVEMIGERRGIGDLLAEGSMRAAQKIGRGAEQFAMHVKGLELAMHEPRSKAGLALGFAVSMNGGDHTSGLQDNLAEKAGPGLRKDGMTLGVLEPLPAYEMSTAKVNMFMQYNKWRTTIDTLGMCYFVPWTIQEVVDLVNAATGWNTTAAELLLAGERTITMGRAYLAREGFTPADDRLPDRFYTVPEKGVLAEAKQTLDRASMKEGAKTFYYFMGWDPETAVPTRMTLERLGVGWIADSLEEQGKLPK